jgi:hypothetical protein
LSRKKFQVFFSLAQKTTSAILPSPDSPAIFSLGVTGMSGRWEKIAAARSAEEMEHFAHLRLITRALGVSHETLADRLGFVRPFDAQEALRGRREVSADEVAAKLLDAWRASRQDYLGAARYLDSLRDDAAPDQI